MKTVSLAEARVKHFFAGLETQGKLLSLPGIIRMLQKF
jgi:hypothetical protein